MAKKVLWQELRRSEFEQFVKADAVVIIPTGSIEQHGNHLPVNTDTNICFTIAQRAAQAIDEFPVLVVPPIWTGYSPMHMAYHGTITLKYNTWVEIVTQVAESVYAHGFKKILILNGHGGNNISAMRFKLIYEHGITPSIAYDWARIAPVLEEKKAVSESDKGSGGHAGEIETSTQLYLQPELVDMSVAIWAPGVVGDPTTATRKKGERVVNRAINALVELLRDYHSGNLEDRLIWEKKDWKGTKTIPSPEDYAINSLFKS